MPEDSAEPQNPPFRAAEDEVAVERVQYQAAASGTRRLKLRRRPFPSSRRYTAYTAAVVA